MATTKIWDVSGRVDHVVKYVENPEKTTNPSTVQWSETESQNMMDVMVTAMEEAKERGLISALEYAISDYKTEQRHFVSGVNCSVGIAREQMMLTKKRWGKEGGIVAYHGIQSFRPDEVSAETAHEIGVKLAQQLWGDRFEVIVATHLNSKCMHNHFVLNSVSFKDGLRYYDQKKTYQRMRDVSDDLCRQYRLSVIDNAKFIGKHYAEWDAERKGQPTWTTPIKQDIDNAVNMSMTWKGFTTALEKMGYTLRYDRKYFAILPPGKTKYVRTYRLGYEYSEESLRRRVMQPKYQQHPPKPEPKTVIRVRVYGDFRLSKVTWQGLRALYFFYLRKLREASRQPPGYAPYALREDIRLMDAISAQAKFLHKYRIETSEQLISHKDTLETDISTLLSERIELRNAIRRTDTLESEIMRLKNRLSEITAALKPLRKEVRLCVAIAERSILIREKNEQLKTQQKTCLEKSRGVNERNALNRIR